MWKYLCLVILVHAAWVGLVTLALTLMMLLDQPWFEMSIRGAVLAFGLCAQAFALPVLGLMVMLWRDRGLGPRASAVRVLELAYGLEFRRRWPWTLSGSLLVVLGLGGLGAMWVVFMFMAFVHALDAVDRVDAKFCPEGV